MKSLRDVLPAGSRTIVLRASLAEDEQISVKVRGIDFNDLGALFAHFPEIYEVLNGGKADASSLLKMLPSKAVNAVIAAGCDVLGDAEMEAGLANLAMFEKLALLAPIVELTMPDGPGPFVAVIRALGLKADSAIPVLPVQNAA